MCPHQCSLSYSLRKWTWHTLWSSLVSSTLDSERWLCFFFFPSSVQAILAIGLIFLLALFLLHYDIKLSQRNKPLNHKAHVTITCACEWYLM